MPASPGPLAVRSSVAPSPFNGEPTIAVLEVDLGVAWPAGATSGAALLGDLPIDRCGMVIGDARALDAFAGINGTTTDGLSELGAIHGLRDLAATGLIGPPHTGATVLSANVRSYRCALAEGSANTTCR